MAYTGGGGGGGVGLPLKGLLFSVFRYIEEYRIHELGKSFIKVFVLNQNSKNAPYGYII